MTRKELEAVHDELTDLIDAENDAAADEDRGRNNAALVLLLHDDGSGMIGRRSWAETDIQWTRDFDDFDGLVKALQADGVEIAGKPEAKS